VRDRPLAERAAFLAEACGDDLELQSEVESLLAESERPDDFFEKPPWESFVQTTGTRIGRYRIEHLLAEGGMGQVYVARQDDPERRVALKLIRPGLISKDLSRRFEQEARILGLMHHPGIAQVHEAGTVQTDHGPQSFFAMEYIEGRPITHHARDQALDIGARLSLFVQVCEAVHHAHQKGVIHRDLKPDNILVENSGRPRILDFGGARATDSDLRATTLQTGMGQLIGTVPYMSPEQVVGDPAELDTRSDVYALGVVCYELLAGRLPHEFGGTSIPEAARMILDEDAARLSSIDSAFRGDIDIIISKALEKNKQRRYQSAAQLAADVERYLSDQPIEARKASTFYQLRKFARRNRGLVAGIAAAFVLLVLGFATTTWQALRATANARQAEDRWAEAEEVTGFLEGVLSSIRPQDLGRDVLVQDVLDRASQTLANELSHRPKVAARLHEVIGRAYRELGLFAGASPHLASAREIRLSLFGERHPDTLRSLYHLALLDRAQGFYPKVADCFRRILEISRDVLGDADPFTIEILSHLARASLDTGDVEGAAAAIEEALETGRRVFDESHAVRVDSMETLARVRVYQENPAAAQELFERCVELRCDSLGASHPDTLRAMNGLAVALSGQKLWPESEAIHRRIISLKEERMGPEHPQTLSSMYNLALHLKKQFRHEASEALFVDAIGRARASSLPDCYWCLGTLLSVYGHLLLTLERFEEAEEKLLEALEIMTGTIGPKHMETVQCVRWLATLYQTLGQPVKAAAYTALADSSEDPAPGD